MIMSTRRKTVYCSYCFQKGHNKQTCPSLKADIENLRQNFGDQHPEVVEYDSNRKSVSASASRRAKMIRRCTYCGAEGHNTRTCSVLKEHIKDATEINKDYCSIVYDRMRECGIGVGAIIKMIRYQSGYRKSTDELYMIVGIKWENINFLEPHRKVIAAKCIKTSDFVDLAIPYNCPDISVNSWEVASPVPCASPPDGWLDGAHIKSELSGLTQEETRELLGLSFFNE